MSRIHPEYLAPDPSDSLMGSDIRVREEPDEEEDEEEKDEEKEEEEDEEDDDGYSE